MNRLRREASGAIDEQRAERARIERQIDKALTPMLEEDAPTAELKARIKTLTARKAESDSALAVRPASVPKPRRTLPAEGDVAPERA